MEYMPKLLFFARGAQGARGAGGARGARGTGSARGARGTGSARGARGARGARDVKEFRIRGLIFENVKIQAAAAKQQQL